MKTIIVNGTPVELLHVQSIADLIDFYHIASQFVLVELNGAVVPRTLYHTTRVNPGDTIELVLPMGGG